MIQQFFNLIDLKDVKSTRKEHVCWGCGKRLPVGSKAVYSRSVGIGKYDGKSAKPKQVAFGYYSQVGDGSESLFTIYKAAFFLPALNSVSFDGKTIRDLTLNVKISPYTYKDAAGKDQQATYTIINSETNKTIWAKAQAAIYVPDSTLP